jgi:hypothetical protein
MSRTIDWGFELPLQTEDELRLFVEKAFGVHIPDVQVCQDHATPWRAFADAYFAKSSVSVWKASRGFGGKSFLLAMLGLTEAVTLKANVNILGGSGEQSERVHEYTQQHWIYQNAPRQVLTSDPSKRETRLVWGNHVRCLMASQRSVRGPHPQRLRLDEIDEMDLTILDAAMGQPMSGDGVRAQTVMSSTHQYSSGTMSKVLRRAADKGWPVYTWCYKEAMEPHGWLTSTDVEEKRNDVTSVMWDVEYELQEPNPESRAISVDAVKAMFDPRLGQYDGANGEAIEVESPVKLARYATGADWARKKDWTIIITYRTDVNPSRLVAFERCGRLPWPVMVGKFNDRLARYRGKGAHDATGIGDVVDGFLDAKADPVLMVGRQRSDLLSNYIAAVERGEYVAPMIRFMEAEHRLAGVEDVYGPKHLPDTIAAGALEHHVESKPRGIGFA